MVAVSIPANGTPAEETAVEKVEVVETPLLDEQPPSESLAQSSHSGITFIVAQKLGLSWYRSYIMSYASKKPDDYQSGISNGFNQQWSHAYIYEKVLWWYTHVWGDADEDYHDNLVGGGDSYGGGSAAYWYTRGHQIYGDWYVGYACHYIQDVSYSVLHTSIPGWYMATKHGAYEEWIESNWETGHKFANTVRSVSKYSYYTVSNLKGAIKSAAKYACYDRGTESKQAWNNWKASGFPTGAGQGNWAAVYYTRLMLIRSTKWTGGTIRYALNRYNQWN
jgi:hypothetical protein